MRKNEYSKRMGGRYTRGTPRNARYAHLSASGRRDGDDSGHSFHELATKPIRSAPRKSKRKPWYAIADPHKPTWGVYSDWEIVKSLRPSRYQGFYSEHDTRQWLEDIDHGRINPPGASGPKSNSPQHAGAKAHIWSTTKPSGRRKKKSNNTWYAVVRGVVPGVYANWDDAKAQTDRFTDSRPYKARSRSEAIEIFMRWSGGAQLYPTSSTMLSRGEVLGEYAGAFLGLEGAEVIRARAFKKHAHARQRKFKETGDPIWDTGTRASETERPVEGAINATTPNAPTKVHAGMDTPASAGVPTTKPSPSASARKESTGQRNALNDSALPYSPMGTGRRNKEAFAPRSRIVTGDARNVQSPVQHRDVEASPLSSNSGAVEDVEVKYVGKGKSSLGDEPLATTEHGRCF